MSQVQIEGFASTKFWLNALDGLFKTKNSSGLIRTNFSAYKHSSLYHIDHQKLPSRLAFASFAVRPVVFYCNLKLILLQVWRFRFVIFVSCEASQVFTVWMNELYWAGDANHWNLYLSFFWIRWYSLLVIKYSYISCFETLFKFFRFWVLYFLTVDTELTNPKRALSNLKYY